MVQVNEEYILSGLVRLVFGVWHQQILHRCTVRFLRDILVWED